MRFSEKNTEIETKIIKHDFWNKSDVYSKISKKSPGLVGATKEIVKKTREMGGEVVFLKRKEKEKEKEKEKGFAGLFDKDNLKIFCFFDESSLSWLPVLIHEFNHLIQYVINTEFSKKYFDFFEKNNADSQILNKMLESKRTVFIKQVLENKKNQKMIRLMVDLESECDTMATAMMKDGGFEDLGYIDVKEYIKNTNLFLFRSIFLEKTGWWICSTSKKDFSNIIEYAPDEHLVNSKTSIPKKIKIYFEDIINSRNKKG